MRVEITCEVNEKQFMLELSLLSSRIKNYKMTYFKWKANEKEHTEEDLFNLSSDNVFLLFVSF